MSHLAPRNLLSKTVSNLATVTPCRAVRVAIQLPLGF